MTRAENVKEAQRLRAQGLTQRKVAELMGARRGTVAEWLNDPDGSKARDRKDSYRGACLKCGQPTDGSNGRAQAPEFCNHCSHEKVWTREAVISAIQQWAKLYGQPPTANDWLHSGGDEHPSRGSVYRSTRESSSPFATWSDAIEAAGFPRRRKGVYKRRHFEKTKRKVRKMAGFIVLQKDGEVWVEHHTDGFNEADAVEKVAEQNGGESHTYVAIRDGNWRPRKLRSVQRLVAELVE